MYAYVSKPLMFCAGNPITTDSKQLPGSDLPNQSNKGFAAGISATVTIIVVLVISGAVILTTLYIRQNKISQGILMIINLVHSFLILCSYWNQ
jgi:hypothetical protein